MRDNEASALRHAQRALEVRTRPSLPFLWRLRLLWRTR